MLTSLATNPNPSARAKSPAAAHPDVSSPPRTAAPAAQRAVRAASDSPLSFPPNHSKGTPTEEKPRKFKPAELHVPFSYGGLFTTTRCPFYIKIFNIKSEPQAERIDFSLDKFAADNVERFVRTVVLKSKPYQIQKDVAIYMLHGDIHRNDMLNSVTSVRVVIVVRIPPNRKKKRQTKINWSDTDVISVASIYALKDKQVQRY